MAGASPFAAKEYTTRGIVRTFPESQPYVEIITATATNRVPPDLSSIDAVSASGYSLILVPMVASATYWTSVYTTAQIRRLLSVHGQRPLLGSAANHTVQFVLRKHIQGASSVTF